MSRLWVTAREENKALVRRAGRVHWATRERGCRRLFPRCRFPLGIRVGCHAVVSASASMVAVENRATPGAECRVCRCCPTLCPFRHRAHERHPARGSFRVTAAVSRLCCPLPGLLRDCQRTWTSARREPQTLRLEKEAVNCCSCRKSVSARCHHVFAGARFGSNNKRKLPVLTINRTPTLRQAAIARRPPRVSRCVLRVKTTQNPCPVVNPMPEQAMLQIASPGGMAKQAKMRKAEGLNHHRFM